MKKQPDPTEQPAAEALLVPGGRTRESNSSDSGGSN